MLRGSSSVLPTVPEDQRRRSLRRPVSTATLASRRALPLSIARR